MSTNGETKEAAATAESPMVKLFKPISVMGKEITELSVDADKLSMGDLHNLEMEYAAVFPGQMPTNGIYMTDTKYQALMIARINGVIYDNLVGMSARDAWNLSNRLGRFLNLPA